MPSGFRAGPFRRLADESRSVLPSLRSGGLCLAPGDLRKHAPGGLGLRSGRALTRTAGPLGTMHHGEDGWWSRPRTRRPSRTGSTTAQGHRRSHAPRRGRQEATGPRFQPRADRARKIRRSTSPRQVASPPRRPLGHPEAHHPRHWSGGRPSGSRVPGGGGRGRRQPGGDRPTLVTLRHADENPTLASSFATAAAMVASARVG